MSKSNIYKKLSSVFLVALLLQHGFVNAEVPKWSGGKNLGHDFDAPETKRGFKPKQKEQKTEQQSASQAESELKAKQYTKAAETLEQLITQNPSSPMVQHYFLEWMHAAYMAKEFEQAASVADQYLDLYSHEVQADYAYLIKGKSLMEFSSPGRFAKALVGTYDWGEIKSLKQARVSFAAIIEHSQDSVYYQEAVQLLKAINAKLATRDYAIAEHYTARGAYLASQERLKESTQLAQDKHTLRKIYKLMAKNARSMKLYDQEKIYRERLESL